MLLDIFILSFSFFFLFFCTWRNPHGRSAAGNSRAVSDLFYLSGLATKWLRILSILANDKIRNHLVANAMYKKIKNIY